MPIKDFYTDETGKKWIPQSFTDAYVYMKSVHFGSVYHAVYRIDEGEVNFARITRTFNRGDVAGQWVRDHSDGLPADFYPSKVHDMLKKAKEAEDE